MTATSVAAVVTRLLGDLQGTSLDTQVFADMLSQGVTPVLSPDTVHSARAQMIRAAHEWLDRVPARQRRGDVPGLVDAITEAAVVFHHAQVRDIRAGAVREAADMFAHWCHDSRHLSPADVHDLLVARARDVQAGAS